MKHVCFALLALALSSCSGQDLPEPEEVHVSRHAAVTAPYPASPVIESVSFVWSTHDRRAAESDNWPITWSSDGHQYTSWGDGPGFAGSAKQSLGFARIKGSRSDYSGVERSEYAAGQPLAGKGYGIVSIGSTLYAWWGPGSGVRSYRETRLLRSTDKGASWTKSTWDLTDRSATLIMPTILNFGKGYAGARDGYVYHYFIRKQSSSTDLSVHKPGHIDLARVPKAELMDANAYQYFAGLNAQGNPKWVADPDQRAPVFSDGKGVGWNVSVSYNAGLGRYLLATEHTATSEGRLGLFDAPEPWGPWTTVIYTESFGKNQIEQSTFFWNFSNKWTSANGRRSALVFSGLHSNDSWNVVDAKFSL